MPDSMKALLRIIFWVLCASGLIITGDSLSAPGTAHRYPTRWRYIVIHHSATAVGNAANMDRYHRRVRHMRNGLAYHFVICNGSSGRKDGQIEIGDRWRKQLHGGHCKQNWYNQHGIGICLVGNFNRTAPTEKQFWSLVWQVKDLMKKYNIPLQNVKGHGGVTGEKTVCPGKKFPWKRLRKYLK